MKATNTYMRNRSYDIENEDFDLLEERYDEIMFWAIIKKMKNRLTYYQTSNIMQFLYNACFMNDSQIRTLNKSFYLLNDPKNKPETKEIVNILLKKGVRYKGIANVLGMSKTTIRRVANDLKNEGNECEINLTLNDSERKVVKSFMLSMESLANILEVVSYYKMYKGRWFDYGNNREIR